MFSAVPFRIKHTPHSVCWFSVLLLLLLVWFFSLQFAHFDLPFSVLVFVLFDSYHSVVFQFILYICITIIIVSAAFSVGHQKLLLST